MNRRTAISRARSLIRHRATRINNKPVISISENGDFAVKIGNGGILIRLSRKDEPIEPDSIEGG